MKKGYVTCGLVVCFKKGNKAMTFTWSNVNSPSMEVKTCYFIYSFMLTIVF